MYYGNAPRLNALLLSRGAAVKLSEVAMYAQEDGVAHSVQALAPEFEEPALVSLKRRVRVLVVISHPLLRAGVLAALAKETDLIVVGKADDTFDAIEQARVLQPDVILLDLRFLFLAHHIDSALEHRLEARAARIVVLTDCRSAAITSRALRAGECACVLKYLVRAAVAKEILELHRGTRLPESSADVGIDAHVYEQILTPRETEVLELVATGNSNKRIARALAIREETVKSHMKSIIQKLGAEDRTHAVTLGLLRGLIQLSCLAAAAQMSGGLTARGLATRERSLKRCR
jgi:two-component system NarL family response regulator